MKKRLITISVFFVCIACAVMAGDIRVMTYNIRHGAGMDDVLNLERTASVINKWGADFVALQEVDSCAKRTHGVDQIRELERLTLMHGTYAAAIPLQGGKYGVGLLSKERPISVRRINMPSRGENRVLLVCEFKNCVVVSTHLSLYVDEHMAAADSILKEAARWQKPFILMGDWNDHPDSPFLERMKQHFAFMSDMSKMTFPADKPNECIDYIAVYTPEGSAAARAAKQKGYTKSGELAVKKSFRVVDEPLISDHRPLVADLVLKTPAPQLMTSQPYLQNPKEDEMTVMFQTNAVCHAWIEYGTDSLHTQRARTMLDGQEVCYDLENKIVLRNLQPGQRYYYRVCLVGLTYKRAYETHYGDTLCTRFYSFRTPSAADKNFTALVFNDLHQVKAVYDTLLTKVNGMDYDLVIFNGDCLPEPVDRNDAIRMIHNLADPINGAEKPIIFVRGNHEIRNFYSAGMHSLIGYPNDKTYGAFNWGDTRFVILDLGEDKPDTHDVYGGLNDFTQLRRDQLAFMQQEFKSKAFRKASRRVLINHIPVFDNADKYRPCTELWGALLKKQPFDINFCAHEHSLKFFAAGEDGQNFPILRGGAPNVKGCSVAVLKKADKSLRLQVLTAEGVWMDKEL